MSQLLSIKSIKQDSALQPRAKMDTAIIDEYTESMKAGASFPPVVVFRVKEDYYLVDGYHRFLAIQGAKFDKVLADIHTGTMRDAILFSASVNATHGIRRSNEDKRRAVLTLLRDPEWGKWADSLIAEKCKVGRDLVLKIRESILPEPARCTPDTPEPTPEKRRVKRAGKTYEMDTAKIGKKKLPPEKCFSPQPGSVPVTDAPMQPSLAEQLRDPEPPAEPVKVPEPRKAPCLSGQPCPDGKDHLNDKKNKCEAWGRYLNQLPFDECWITVKERRDAQRGSGESLFHSAGANVPPKSTQSLPPISKHPLLKKRDEQDAATSRFIDDCLTDRYHRIIRDAMIEQNLGTPLDAIYKGLDLLSECEGEV